MTDLLREASEMLKDKHMIQSPGAWRSITERLVAALQKQTHGPVSNHYPADVNEAYTRGRCDGFDAGLLKASQMCERRADSLPEGSGVARQCAADIRALLDSKPKQTGTVLVPVEPTQDMTLAGTQVPVTDWVCSRRDCEIAHVEHCTVNDIYKAMIAAAEKP